MRGRAHFALGLLTIAAASAPAAQSGAQAFAERVTVFRGALLIVGDDSEPISDAAFVVRGSSFASLGRSRDIDTPSGARIVDLTGKTVMPALIDAHSHIGYMRDLTSGPENYTRENILDHMHRFAYYGVAASQSMGTDFGVLPFELRDEILAGQHPDAARFLTAGRGLAPLDEISAGNMRHAAYVVTTEEGARADVRELASRGVSLIKFWLTNREGQVRPLAPNLYAAIIDEAHLRGMRVMVHATEIEHAKSALRAGVDVFGHMIADVDDELIELFRARPKTAVLLAQVGRRTIHAPYLDPPEPALAETVSAAQIARLRERIASTPAAQLARAQQDWTETALDIMRLHRAGVRIAIGSDGGGQGGDRFIGFTAHTELENMVAAGMTPGEAIVAGTSNGAEVLGLADELGTVAVGKSADFIVLDANPLEDITHSRKIDSVYLRGREVDRARLRRSFSAAGAAARFD